MLSRFSRRRLILLVACGAIAITFAQQRAARYEAQVAAAKAKQPRVRRAAPGILDAPLLAKKVAEGHRLIAPTAAGGRAELTLIPELQTRLEGIFARYPIPKAGAVALSIPSGDVLAMLRCDCEQRCGRRRGEIAEPCERVHEYCTGPAASV